jgi:orotidine-5'-phosphate decarboxylase
MEVLEIVNQIKSKRSFLCVGLDVDLDKIPKFLLDRDNPIFEFNKSIIDSTNMHCIAYKLNIAFYEAYGIKGWKALEKTINYINNNYPEIFTIADAKRGDIGNTSKMYAKSFFEKLNFDSITVNPYMGRDSVEPFLEYKDKNTIILGLTSNEGSKDLQLIPSANEYVFMDLIKSSKTWNNSKNLMYVIGATKTEYLEEIRKIIPDNFLLIPGVGAQGGNLKEVCKKTINQNVGIIINSSRGIIYSGNDENFDQAAAKQAIILKNQMEEILIDSKLI